MNIWEKSVVNMQKGAKKVAAAAAVFAERVRIELTLVRLRIRIDEVQARRDELYGTIGRKIVDLNKRDELPKTTELLLKDEDIVAAVVELADREQEIDELNNEIKNIQADFKTTAKHTEDTLS